MLHLSPSRTKVVLLLWVLKCLYFCILKQKAKSYYTFKLKELISVFLKLIESRKTKIGWDYSCVKFLNCGITNVCVPPSWRGTLGAKPANIWTRVHVALQENCCDRELLLLERFEQTQLLPCSVTQIEVLSVEESVLQHASFYYCFFDLLWLHSEKKNCYLTLYLTSKLRLVVVSSAMFIFHQIMFVSNVCKS